MAFAADYASLTRQWWNFIYQDIHYAALLSIFHGNRARQAHSRRRYEQSSQLLMSINLPPLIRSQLGPAASFWDVVDTFTRIKDKGTFDDDAKFFSGGLFRVCVARTTKKFPLLESRI